MNYYKVALSKYAVFTGRSQRAEYWFFTFYTLAINMIFGLVQFVILTNEGGTMSSEYSLISTLSTLFTLAMIIPGLAVAIRRLHDIGKSGWWVLIAFVPLIGVLVLLLFFIRDSQEGSNVYGENPKGVGGTSDSSNSNSNNTNSDAMSGGFPTSAPKIQ